MAFSTKDWKDSPDATTPITAAALEDMETRLAAYTDGLRGAASGMAELDSLGYLPIARLGNLQPVAQRFVRDLYWANSMSAAILTTTGHASSSGAWLLDFNIVVVGDSTGVDGSSSDLRWPHLLCQSLAALYPNLQFRYYQWNDTNQSFDVPSVINTPATINATVNLFNCSKSGTTEDYWLRSGSTTASLTSGATTSGSRVVTVADTTQAFAKNGISGTGIPGGTTIVTVDSATQLTISNDASATNTGLTLTATVPRRLDVIASVNPNLVLVNHGHNSNALFAFPLDPQRFRERIQALTESISFRCPRAKLVLIGQNEEVSPAANAGPNIQGIHARELRTLAHLYGYDFIDIYDVFHNAAGGPSAWLTADGVHPTYDNTGSPSTLGTPNSGSALWRDAVYRALAYVPGWPDKPQQAAGLSEIAGSATGQATGTKQLLLNGDFTEYTTSGGSGAGTPASWTVNGNVAFAKDTTNFEFPYTSSLKCTASASTTNQCYIEQKIAGSTAPMPASRLQGRMVTVAVRMRCASGQRAGLSCKLNVQDGVSDSTQTLTYDLAWDTSTGGFFWAIASRFIPYNATRVWLDIYIDSGTDNAQANVVSIQRAIAVVGERPRDIVL